MPLDQSQATPCNTCGEPHAKKAVVCPSCGMLLRPNYVIVLAMTGVWFFSFVFGLLYFAQAVFLRV